MYSKISYQAFLAILLFLITNQLSANITDEKKRVIDQLTAAYGGEKLFTMNSIRVESHYKSISLGGGYNPDVADINLRNTELVIDFEKQRAGLKTWTKNNNGTRLGTIYNDGDTGHSINYFRGTHVLRPDLNFQSVAGSGIRMLDLNIAKLLVQQQALVSYQGTKVEKGRVFKVLNFQINKNMLLTLSIDSDTGLIAKMTRSNGLVYLYSDYQVRDGLTYASDTSVIAAGNPNTITLSRNVSINPDLSQQFKIPQTIRTISGGMLDSSKMVVNKIAHGTFLVGKGFRYSLFVDLGDGWFEAGALAGIKERLAAVNRYSNKNLSLKYQAIPYHGHLGGVKEAVNLGAKIITASAHQNYLKKSLNTELENSDLLLVNEKLMLNNGGIELYDINTSLAEHSLLVYLPDLELAFSMDHFTTQVKNSLPGPGLYSSTFRDALDRLDLKINSLYDGHTPKVFTFDDLNKVTTRYEPKSCLKGHKICQAL